MKKILIHILTLAAVFVLAVFGISYYLNQGTTDTTETMAKASFPLVYMTSGGTKLNCLHGYSKSMDVTAMRDTLTPLEDDRTLTIQVEPYQNKINEISYTIMSSDGEKILEKTKVNKLTEDGSYVTAALQMQDTLLINTEYVMELQVTAGSQKLYYYTRVIYEDGLHTKSYLDFAMGFYERCLNKNDLSSISAYIEPNEEGDNSTFAFMDIHCSMDHLSWGNLSPSAYYKPTPSIKEINGSTATVVMEYMISAQNDQNETELFAVSEYYRMLYTEERIRLLDFERTAREIFNPENSGVIRSDGINLGVAGRDVVYKNDLKNNYFAFVQQGALWMYQVSSNKMTQVFSFPQDTDSDARDTYRQNDIQIVDIDEGGNMYFLVCGYMNRGRHEGESGVAVYYFNALDSSITEILFVNTTENYELLKRDVEALNYISQDLNYFYICVDSNVYGINLATFQAEMLVSGLKEGAYASSHSGRWFAWMSGSDKYHAQTIEILDLNTREKKKVTCENTELVQLLGFLDEDLVYGVADAADVTTEHEGMEFFPMKTIQIVNAGGEILKEYGEAGYYVTDVSIDSRMLTMNRVRKQGDTYEEAPEDHIVSSKEEEGTQFGITIKNDATKKAETVLNTGTSLKTGGTVQIVRSRETIQEGSKTVTLEAQAKKDVYYVYAKGKLYDVFTSICSAVKTANEELGVVVDSNMQNIWERGNKVTKIRLDVTTFPDVILKGSFDVGAVEAGTGKKALDLSGCTLDSVLYYVSEGTSILARTPVTEKTPQGVVIIAGYDEYNTILLNPGETETFYYGLQDSTALFEEAGNLFLTYWDPISE